MMKKHQLIIQSFQLFYRRLLKIKLEMLAWTKNSQIKIIPTKEINIEEERTKEPKSEDHELVDMILSLFSSRDKSSNLHSMIFVLLFKLNLLFSLKLILF